jgi:hypothetical protein
VAKVFAAFAAEGALLGASQLLWLLESMVEGVFIDCFKFFCDGLFWLKRWPQFLHCQRCVAAPLGE